MYYSQKDYTHVTSVLEQGLALQPDSWRAEAVLGNAYYRQGDYEKAREHAEKALAIGKDEAGGLGLLLGRSLAALGRKQEAIAALQTFVAQQPASEMTKAAQELLKQLQLVHKDTIRRQAPVAAGKEFVIDGELTERDSFKKSNDLDWRSWPCGFERTEFLRY